MLFRILCYLLAHGEPINSTEVPDLTYRTANRIVESLVSNIDNVKFLELDAVFCKEGRCLQIDKAGFPLYRDGNHLSAYGAIWASDEVLVNADYQWLGIFLMNNRVC